jgi:hypothetical protein
MSHEDNSVTYRPREADVSWRWLEDEIVVLDKRTWNYLSLNPAAALMWERMVTGAATREALAESLIDAYGIEPVRAATDVEGFLAMLSEHGLLAP